MILDTHFHWTEAYCDPYTQCTNNSLSRQIYFVSTSTNIFCQYTNIFCQSANIKFISPQIYLASRQIYFISRQIYFVSGSIYFSVPQYLFRYPYIYFGDFPRFDHRLISNFEISRCHGRTSEKLFSQGLFLRQYT